MKQYLQAGFYTNSDHPKVIEYTQSVIRGISDKQQQLIALFYAVRDGFRYNPYHLILKPYALKASFLLTKDYGYCVEKSNLFAACARVLGVPSRLGYGNVCNHLGTKDIEQKLKTNILVFHGFTEVFINDQWVKATPVFNKELCQKLGVEPLDFDAKTDCIFQESDKDGNPFMEYIHDYGTFADVPFEKFKTELLKFYPHLFDKQIRTDKFTIEFDERPSTNQ